MAVGPGDPEAVLRERHRVRRPGLEVEDGRALARDPGRAEVRDGGAERRAPVARDVDEDRGVEDDERGVARRRGGERGQVRGQVAHDHARRIAAGDLDRGAAALWQSLLKLHTRASMLMIDAHPDDEDGGLLAYESRGQGARVALLTLNRGEAGQNLMNADYFDAMGLLRTEELLAADEYYGVQQYFGRVIDFGFSKSKQETLQKWAQGQTLSDAVRVVRMVRPLVVTSVFVGTYSDGHGNHPVAG